MNKRNIVFFMALFVSYFGDGQDCSSNSPVSINLTEELSPKSALVLLNTTYSINDLNKSIGVIDCVYAYSKKNNFLLGIGKSHVAYAHYFYQKGDYVTAMEHSLNAIKVLDKTDDTYSIREAKNCIAKLERENKNFNKGISICLDLIEEIKDEEPTEQLARIYLNTANIFMNFKDDNFKKAEFYLKESKKIFTALGCEIGVGCVDVKYGRYYKILYLKTKDQAYFEEIKRFTNNALRVFKDTNQYNNIAYVYYTQATAYSIAAKHEASLEFYNKALENYKKSGDLVFMMRVKQHLFVAHSILNNHEKALKSNNEYVALKDSIFNLEKRALIIDSQTKFETEKIRNEKELAELQSDKNQKMFFSVTIIAGLILLTSLFYFDKLKLNKKAELVSMRLKQTQENLAVEKLYRDSELKALKAQMNPHFIFNALNSIQEYIVLNEKELASDYLGKFADLIRKYLNYSTQGYISIQEEIECLKIYLDLEKLRFEDKLNYSITIAGTNQLDDAVIPTMIIQPYIENAIKHGLLHRKDNRKLSVNFEFDLIAKLVICSIEDNGIGREKSALLKARKNKNYKSFATMATKDRLNLINYGKEKKVGVVITDLYDNKEAAGTLVQVIIPFKII